MTVTQIVRFQGRAVTPRLFFISKTTQIRAIVTVKRQQELACGLLSGVMSHDGVTTYNLNFEVTICFNVPAITRKWCKIQPYYTLIGSRV